MVDVGCIMFEVWMFECSVLNGSAYGSEYVANEIPNRKKIHLLFLRMINSRGKIWKKNQWNTSFESSQLCIVQGTQNIASKMANGSEIGLNPKNKGRKKVCAFGKHSKQKQ